LVELNAYSARAVLQLVSRARLVCCQRPGNRVEGEIVIVIGVAAVRGRNIERQYELAALPGVVQERRR